MVIPWMLGLLTLHLILYGTFVGFGRVRTQWRAALKLLISCSLANTFPPVSAVLLQCKPSVYLWHCVSAQQVIGRRPIAAAALAGMNATLITASQRQRRSADGRNQWLIGSQEDLEPVEAVV